MHDDFQVKILGSKPAKTRPHPRSEPFTPQQAERDAADVAAFKEHVEQLYDRLLLDEPAKGQPLYRKWETCPYTHGLDLFLAAAYFGLWCRPGVIGYLKSTPNQFPAMLEHTADVLQRLHQGPIPFDVITRLGDIRPFPLLYLEKAVDLLREQDHTEYALLRGQGLVTPANVFDARLAFNQYFLVVCSLDMPATFGSNELRTAKYVIKGLLESGIPILATVRDTAAIDELQRAGLLTVGENTFNLGRF